MRTRQAKTYGIALCALLLIPGLSFTTASGQNLVLDPGFEDVKTTLDGWVHWTGNGLPSSSMVISGSWSALLYPATHLKQQVNVTVVSATHEFKVSVKNPELNLPGRVEIRIVDFGGTNHDPVASARFVDVAPGERNDVSLDYALDPGQYWVEIWNNFSANILIDDVTLTGPQIGTPTPTPGGSSPTPTPSPTDTPTPSPTPTETPTVTPTPTTSVTPTPTNTLTPTPSPTVTPTPIPFELRVSANPSTMKVSGNRGQSAGVVSRIRMSIVSQDGRPFAQATAGSFLVTTDPNLGNITSGPSAVNDANGDPRYFEAQFEPYVVTGVAPIDVTYNAGGHTLAARTSVRIEATDAIVTGSGASGVLQAHEPPVRRTRYWRDLLN